MEPPTITFRDPVELRLHPLQRALPEPDKTSVEWHSFVDGIAACGPEAIPPLICTKEGLVMDGGRRWRAAKQLQWTCVPVIERPDRLLVRASTNFYNTEEEVDALAGALGAILSGGPK